MVIKSLTITEEAYDALKAMKMGNESFSDVILRISKKKVGAATKHFGALKMNPEDFRKWKANILKEKKIFDEEMRKREKEIRRRL